MRLDAIELAAEGTEGLGKTAGRDDERRLASGPALLDAADDPVDRLRLTEHDTGANAVLGPAPNHARWHDELRRRQLRRAPDEGIERRLHARRDDAADEDAITRYAVERRGGAHVHDNGITAVEARRGERVDQSIGTDGERLVGIDADRQLRARVDDDHGSVGECVASRDERLGDSWHDRADGGTSDVGGGEALEGEQPAKEHAEFVGGALDAGDNAPVTAERFALEETDGRLGVTDVEDEDHGREPNEFSGSRTREPA